MNAITPFNFDGTELRVIDQGGEPWFVANDVCRVLEHSNSRMALSRLDDDEKGVTNVYTLGGEQQVAIVSESGLYSLILTSRKPEAKRFKKWVTSEVLPSIRKTGAYGAPAISPASMSRLELIKLAMQAEEEKLALETQVNEMAPKVEALERIAEADGSMSITDAAKTLQVKPGELFKYLRGRAWVYKRVGSTVDIAYQDKLQSGVMEHKLTTVTKPDGSEKVITQARITPKGLARLSQELGQH